MDKEIIDKVMFDNFLMSVPTMVVDTKDRKTISAYGSIDVDDLRSAIDTFKKVPDYGELLKQVKKQKEVIDKANKKLNNFIDCCKAEKLESGSDYIHHQYWDMFERFNKQIKDILNEVSE